MLPPRGARSTPPSKRSQHPLVEDEGGTVRGGGAPEWRISSRELGIPRRRPRAVRRPGRERRLRQVDPHFRRLALAFCVGVLPDASFTGPAPPGLRQGPGNRPRSSWIAPGSRCPAGALRGRRSGLEFRRVSRRRPIEVGRDAAGEGSKSPGAWSGPPASFVPGSGDYSRWPYPVADEGAGPKLQALRRSGPRRTRRGSRRRTSAASSRRSGSRRALSTLSARPTRCSPSANLRSSCPGWKPDATHSTSRRQRRLLSGSRTTRKRGSLSTFTRFGAPTTRRSRRRGSTCSMRCTSRRTPIRRSTLAM